MKVEVFNQLYVDFFKRDIDVTFQFDFESKQQIRTSQWKTICTYNIS